MRKLAGIIAALLALASVAHASPSVAIQRTGAVAKNGTQFNTFESKFGEIVDAADFGPLACDGVTDDTATIAAWATYIRSKWTTGPVRAFIPYTPAGCLVTTTINLTGQSTKVPPIPQSDISLGHILGSTNGTAVVDMMDSGYFVLEPFQIDGIAGGLVPNIGLKLGHINSTGGRADNIVMHEPSITGTFTSGSCSTSPSASSACAPFYDFGTEDLTIYAPTFINKKTTGATFGAIFDGCNHFLITSAYVTNSIGRDVCKSYNNVTVYGGSIIQASTSGFSMFLGGTRNPQFHDVYLCDGCFGSPGNGSILAMAEAPNGGAGGQLENVRFDNNHIETTSNPVGVVFASMNAGSPLVIFGWYYNDFKVQDSSSFFKRDQTGVYGTSNVTTISVNDMEFTTQETTTGTGIAVLDSPTTDWTVSGKIIVPYSNMWPTQGNLGGGSGILCVGTSCGSYGAWSLNAGSVSAAGNIAANNGSGYFLQNGAGAACSGPAILQWNHSSPKTGLNGAAANLEGCIDKSGTSTSRLHVDATSATLPDGASNTAGSIVTTNGTQDLTNKTYNGNTFTAGTGILTIAAGKTLTMSNTLTFTGTDSTTEAFGGGLTIAAGKTFGVNNSITFSGTDAVAYTLPTTAALAPLASPVFTGTPSAGTIKGGTGASNSIIFEGTSGTGTGDSLIFKSGTQVTNFTLVSAGNGLSTAGNIQAATAAFKFQSFANTLTNNGTCNAANEGARGAATDLLTPTFLTTAVGGGAVHGSLYCNGTNWVTD